MALSLAETVRKRRDAEFDNHCTWECLDMVRERIQQLGEDMSATPPMCYDDAISSLVFNRLKEAGAFPGQPATVRYVEVEPGKHYRKEPIHG